MPEEKFECMMLWIQVPEGFATYSLKDALQTKGIKVQTDSNKNH